ncbi:MAG: ferredoxin family protein [Candidatus Bathyarchaeia archaeon]
MKWHPTIEYELCIGCGLCVLGCSASVYAFDYEKKRPVVIAPLKCKVGCITCANTCPVHAIGFPPLSYLHRIIRKRGVLTTSRKELKDNREQISYQE